VALGSVFDNFPMYDENIFSGDFNAKVGREDILKYESPHKISNDNGIRVVNFAICKNLVVRSTIFPHRYIHKYNWASPGGKTTRLITF
jgi:hypothetical protein